MFFTKTKMPSQKNPTALREQFIQRLDSLIADYVADIGDYSAADALEQCAKSIRLRIVTTSPVY